MSVTMHALWAMLRRHALLLIGCTCFVALNTGGTVRLPAYDAGGLESMYFLLMMLAIAPFQIGALVLSPIWAVVNAPEAVQSFFSSVLGLCILAALDALRFRRPRRRTPTNGK